MEVVKYSIGKNEAVLTGYLQSAAEAIKDSSNRPAVLILPGGGYEYVSMSENEPIAMSYAAKGFQPFTLEYSVKEKGVFPVPQREAFEAISFIRKNAAKLRVNADKVAAAGLSAGGHLAASLGVHWNNPDVNPLADRKSGRPDALALVYPCITAGEYAYPGINDVHGKGTDFPQLLSLENYVDDTTPPSFICHTAADMCVPVMNSLLFAQGLAKHGVPFALHVYKDGPHGMGLATAAVTPPLLQTLDDATRIALKEVCAQFSTWFDLSAQFLRAVL